MHDTRCASISEAVYVGMDQVCLQGQPGFAGTKALLECNLRLLLHKLTPQLQSRQWQWESSEGTHGKLAKAYKWVGHLSIGSKAFQ